MNRSYQIIFSTVYAITLAVFALFWGENFSNFVYTKGDDFFVCVVFVIMITYLFLLFLYLGKYKIDIALILILPLIIALISFIVGIVVLLALNINGTPPQITYTYTAVFGITTLLSLNFIEQRRKKKVRAN